MSTNTPDGYQLFVFHIKRAAHWQPFLINRDVFNWLGDAKTLEFRSGPVLDRGLPEASGLVPAHVVASAAVAAAQQAGLARRGLSSG